MADDRTMPPELFEQLTPAFLHDRHELVDHLRTAHQAGPACSDADPASLNRQHWDAHGSDLASFLEAHPVQV